MAVKHGYFAEVQSYKTYEGKDFDFHFDYNANSGGGQAFLGGTFELDGEATSPRELDGATAQFALQFTDGDGKSQTISLGGSAGVNYLIKPRGKGSQSVKLEVDGRPNPSRLLSVALLLPEPTGVGKSSFVEHSPLAHKNYWVRSMWLGVDQLSANAFQFLVRDVVVSGKKFQGETAEEVRFFKLDIQARVTDLLSLDIEQLAISESAKNAIIKFQKYFAGEDQFDFEKLNTARTELLQGLSQQYPSEFSGSIDPLPFLQRLTGAKEQIDIIPAAQVSGLSRNLIYFGAPGVGKSRTLSKLANTHFSSENIRRITFYPDYGYPQFFGSYKPISVANDDSSSGATEIQYRFVPGPLFEATLQALATPEQDFLLIVEEINRSNPASVFGDVFQLLDRSPTQESTYSIRVAAEVLEYVRSRYGAETNSILLKNLLSCGELKLPSNLYLWATMNSADQGVFPMDTAFRRRWDFQYLNVNENESDILEYVVELGAQRVRVRWNDLRKAINQRLIDLRINEDKLLGTFFLPPRTFEDADVFNKAFKNKVLLYLFEDVAKSRREAVFVDGGRKTFAMLQAEFDAFGHKIFNDLPSIEEIDETDVDTLAVQVEDSASEDNQGT